MFEASLLSAVYMENCEELTAKSEFSAWLAKLQQERLAALDKARWQDAPRIEFNAVLRVVQERIRLFNAQSSRFSREMLETGTLLFRYDSSTLDGVVEMESEGFFDIYDTPHPAYWADCKLFPGIEGPSVIIVSWLPQELQLKFRNKIQYSCTGELVWFDDLLEPPEVVSGLKVYALECMNRMKKLSDLMID